MDYILPYYSIEVVFQYEPDAETFTIVVRGATIESSKSYLFLSDVRATIGELDETKFYSYLSTTMNGSSAYRFLDIDPKIVAFLDVSLWKLYLRGTNLLTQQSSTSTQRTKPRSTRSTASPLHSDQHRDLIDPVDSILAGWDHLGPDVGLGPDQPPEEGRSSSGVNATGSIVQVIIDQHLNVTIEGRVVGNLNTTPLETLKSYL